MLKSRHRVGREKPCVYRVPKGGLASPCTLVFPVFPAASVPLFPAKWRSSGLPQWIGEVEAHRRWCYET